MSTTQIFVELLGIGFQGLLLLYAIYRLIVGPDALLITNINFNINLVLLVAPTYIIGIFIDRLSDSIFSLPERILKIKPNKDYSYLRYFIYYHSDTIQKVIDYIRARIRISRSTVLIFLLILLCHIISIKIYGENIKYFWGIKIPEYIFIIFYIIIILWASYIYYESQIKYYKRLELNYKIICKYYKKKRAYNQS